MRVIIFSTKSYDRAFLETANAADAHHLTFVDSRLTRDTARLAQGHEAVCVFVNDRIDEEIIETLRAFGVRLIALRCAGFNNVDLHASARATISVCRVPSYSPHAIAEHTVGMVLALNRKLHRAYKVFDGGSKDRPAQSFVAGDTRYDYLAGESAGCAQDNVVGTQQRVQKAYHGPKDLPESGV
jgi:lactate dehydrogenase-like 2-hydroxyacid dehydrogenase